MHWPVKQSEYQKKRGAQLLHSFANSSRIQNSADTVRQSAKPIHQLHGVACRIERHKFPQSVSALHALADSLECRAKSLVRTLRRE